MSLDVGRVVHALEGRSFVDPDAEVRAALEALSTLGLVRVGWSRVFQCSAWAGEEPYCRAWVTVPEVDVGDEDPAWHEDAGEVSCTSCGRERYPLREHRSTVDSSRVLVDEDGVAAWMERRLRGLDPYLRVLREGIGWRLELDGEDVVVVWLDRSLGARTTTRAFAAAQTVVYVTHTPRVWSTRFREDPGIVLLPLGTWVVEGDGALSSAVARAVGAPSVIIEPAIRPWARTRQPDVSRAEVSSAPPGRALPVLPGTRWNQVKLWLVDGDTVRFVVPGRTPRSYTAAELGLTNRRSQERRRTKAWSIVEALCEGRGHCDWHAGGCRSFEAFKVQASELAKRLREFTGIEESPFHPLNRRDGLRTVFVAGPLPEPEPYVGEDRWQT